MYWMHKLKTMRGKVSTNEIYINRYENIKQISCSPYIREERRSLIMNVLYMYYMFLYVWLFFIIFSSFYYLFTPSNYIITIIIITIMLINVNVTGIVEQQREGVIKYVDCLVLLLSISSFVFISSFDPHDHPTVLTFYISNIIWQYLFIVT